MWQNEPISVASLGGIAPEDLTWLGGHYGPGDVVTISTDLQTFVSTSRSELGGPGSGATELNDLTDVGIVTPLDKQIFQYDTANTRWTNVFLDYDDLTNVPIVFPPDTHGHAATEITYNNISSGLSAINVQTAIDEVNSRVDAGGDPLSLNDLTDVTIGTLTEGEILSFSGTQWENGNTIGVDLFITGDLNITPNGGGNGAFDVVTSNDTTVTLSTSGGGNHTLTLDQSGTQSTVGANRDLQLTAGNGNDLNIGSGGEAIIIDGNTVTIHSLQYPATDGTVGQVLTTSGTGFLSFQDIPAAGIPEAPEDDIVYGRENAAWVAATEEAPIDGQTYVRKDGDWEVVSSNGNNAESARINYNGLGTVDSVVNTTAGIISTTIDSSQWVEFSFAYNRPPSSIVYYGYKDLGANGWGYKMTIPASGNQDNTVLTGGTAGSPAELLTNMTVGKIRLQMRTQETFASSNEHAYIFLLF